MRGPASGRSTLSALAELVCLVAACVAALLGARLLEQLHQTGGLECRDYAATDWTGAPFAIRIEPNPGAPHLVTRAAAVHERFSSECGGWLAVANAGAYEFALTSDDGSELEIGGHRIDNSGVHADRTVTGIAVLDAGAHRLRIRYTQFGGAAGFQLLMGQPSGPLHPLDPEDVSRRPLSRAENVVRTIAPAIAVVVGSALSIVLLWRLNRFANDRPSAWARRVHEWCTATDARALTILAGCGTAVRLLATLGTYAILWPDSESYYSTALAQVRGDFYSHELFRTPLFPAFLASFLVWGVTPVSGAAIIAAQRALGVLCSVLVHRIGRAAFGPKVAFYGALAWSLSPLELYYETVVTSDALFAFLIILAVWAAVMAVTRGGTVRYALVGAYCGLATLTRPVGKGLALVLAAVIAMVSSERRRVAGPLAALLLASLAVTLPWMYVNDRTYGFFGISRGEGLGLFIRVFDADALPAPETTRYPMVRESFDRLRAAHPYLHFILRDDLNYKYRLSAAQADAQMFGFALEAAEERPIRFVADTVGWWVRLFIAPHRSVQICETPHGPHWCSERTIHTAYAAFPNRPFPEFAWLKSALAFYADALYVLTPLAAPFAVFGMTRWLFRRDARSQAKAILAATVVYLTTVPVVFNSAEDRYRLPAESLILLFAMDGVAALRRVGGRPVPSMSDKTSDGRVLTRR